MMLAFKKVTHWFHKNFDGERIEFVRTNEVFSGIANTRFRRDCSDSRGDNDGWTGTGS